MEAELNQLEAQIEQLISLYENAKMENRELKALVVKLEAENRILGDKVNLAIGKFDDMLTLISENQNR